MVIDLHAHFPLPNRNPPPDDRPADFADRLVDQLPAAGIDRICLCSVGPQLGSTSNETVLAASRKFPERISALAFVELGQDRPEDIRRYAGEGYAGFKVTNPPAAYEEEAFFPVYEQMQATGLPLLAHTGIVMRAVRVPSRRVSSNWMRPVCLDAVLRSFPGLNIVGAHLGAPWHEEASMMARMHPNYYVDLSGAAWGGWRANKGPEFYRYHFFWEGAWEKVLFGTDILALDELLPAKRFHDNLIASLGLPAETVKKIYGDTARTLLRQARV